MGFRRSFEQHRDVPSEPRGGWCSAAGVIGDMTIALGGEVDQRSIA